MEYIKFNLSGELAFFKDPHRNDGVECSYPHIHKPVILGICGAILGLRGRESDMEYYHKLGTMGVSIVPSKLKFNTTVDTITNTTCFGNTDGHSQIIRKLMLVDPSWNIYLKQNKVEDNLWQELKERLINKNFVYGIGLGERKLFADITDVKIGEMELVDTDEVGEINSIIYRSDIDDDIETNRIEFTAPTDLYEIDNMWEYVSDRLFFTNQYIDGIAKNIEIYDTGEVYIRFI